MKNPHFCKACKEYKERDDNFMSYPRSHGGGYAYISTCQECYMKEKIKCSKCKWTFERNFYPIKSNGKKLQTCRRCVQKDPDKYKDVLLDESVFARCAHHHRTSCTHCPFIDTCKLRIKTNWWLVCQPPSHDDVIYLTGRYGSELVELSLKNPELFIEKEKEIEWEY